jgi:hypothetical protein
MKTSIKVLALSGIAAAVIGGGAAIASAAAPSPSPSGGSSTTAAHPKLDKLKALKGRFEHGESVVKGKDGAAVTVSSINGAVTSVSATSIAVKADDGTTFTYVVDANTKVHVLTAKTSTAKGSAADAKISDIAVGNNVIVVGTKSGDTLTARQIAKRA